MAVPSTLPRWLRLTGGKGGTKCLVAVHWLTAREAIAFPFVNRASQTASLQSAMHVCALDPAIRLDFAEFDGAALEGEGYEP